MLLNTLKTSLSNLFNSNLNEKEIKATINQYLLNEDKLEASKNEVSIKYFSNDFLFTIKNKDIIYFYNIDQKMYKSKRSKKVIMNTLSKISFV